MCQYILVAWTLSIFLRLLTAIQVPYTPAPSNSSQGLDQATTERIDRIENVLSAVVRHNPGIGGYEAVREWLSCMFHHHRPPGGVTDYSASTFQRFVGSSASTPVSPLIPSTLNSTPIVAAPRRKPTGDGQPIQTDDIENLDRGGSAEDDARVGKGWLGELEGCVNDFFLSRAIRTHADAVRRGVPESVSGRREACHELTFSFVLRKSI